MHTICRAAALAAAFATVAIGTGCAFGQKIGYSDVVADIEAEGDHKVAVATHDQRPYVVSGDKEPTFVGLMRGGYGNPFDVKTVSGAPMGQDMSQSIADSLDSRGFDADVVAVRHSDSRRAVKQSLLDAAAERIVLLTLREWKSDKFWNTSVIHDVRLQVFDQAGEELASETFTGDDNIGNQSVAEAFRRKIEDWFSEPEIVKALR